jgi:hypothetical protein
MLKELAELAKTYKETGKLADMTVTPLVEGISTEGLREWVGVLVDDTMTANHGVRMLSNQLVGLGRMVASNRGAIFTLAAITGFSIGWFYHQNRDLQKQIDELREQVNA